MSWIGPFLVAAVVFGVLDFVWLGKVGRPLYDARLGDQLLAKPRKTSAYAFYVLYLVGVTHFVTAPAVAEGDVWMAAWTGALFGLVAYATWNLTNHAVLRDFPGSIIPIDLTWGTLATSATAAITTAVCLAVPFLN